MESDAEKLEHSTYIRLNLIRQYFRKEKPGTIKTDFFFFLKRKAVKKVLVSGNFSPLGSFFPVLFLVGCFSNSCVSGFRLLSYNSL